MNKVKLFKKLPSKKVKCLACEHRCKIPPSTMHFKYDRTQSAHSSIKNTGICGVRANTEGGLQLLVYGRVIAANIDPIEKKPLYHFLPGSKIFSIGTVGCNFGCDFCQNADISQITKISTIANKNRGYRNSSPREAFLSSEASAKLEAEWGQNFDISQASKPPHSSSEKCGDKMGGIDVAKMGYKLSPKKIVDYCVKEKIPSIAFTYNEPTIFSEYAVDVMKLARKHKVYGVYVSNGFFTKECFDYISPYIDAFNIDLKSFSDEYYRKICKARLAPVKDSIKRVFKARKHLEITTLVVPGKNDSEKELTQIAKFIASVSKDIPWHISAFYPTYKMTENISTPEEKLFEAYEIGKYAGLKYVYTGNIADQRHSQTLCPKCGFVVIARNGFEAISKLQSSRCPNCKNKVYGIY